MASRHKCGTKIQSSTDLSICPEKTSPMPLSQTPIVDKLKPATCLNECIVGPNSKEREDGSSCWGSIDVTKRSSSNIVNAPSTLTSTPTILKRKRDDFRGNPTKDNDTFTHAIQTFHSSGCCVIPNVLPSKFISKSREKTLSDLSYLENSMQKLKQQAISQENSHLLSRVARNDFREIIDRDGGRRDVRFQLDRYPFTASGLVYNSIVYPFIQKLLCCDDPGKKEGVNLLYAGIMWALPSSSKEKQTHQKWHADGGHLFHHAHLPPHCINVFYPLVDITPENGPTEVLPGTHVSSYVGNSEKIPLCCKAGDAVIFDYRLQHRGNANLSDTSRPILYLCYAKTWFRDAGNTRSDHSLFQCFCENPTDQIPHRPSPPWVARILRGDPVDMGRGFEWKCAGDKEEIEGKINETKPQNSQNNMSIGSGERWILFKMNVELPGSENPKILTVHHGDISLEVSSQFCKENQLGDDFIPVLAETIDVQMKASLSQK